MSRTTERPHEPGISVAMESDLIVVHPRRDLDRPATETFVAVVDAATRLGVTVSVPFDTDAGPDPLSGVIDPELEGHRANGGGPAEVVGPGRIRLHSSAAWWTIDVGRRRVCRSERSVDWRFVAPEWWTSIRSLWVAGGRVAVITDAGECLSIAASWCCSSTPSSSRHDAGWSSQRPRVPAA